MTIRVHKQHLFSGRDVNLINLQPDDIDMVDIAHALGMICRFSGHARWHYSVAQHCVYVAERVFQLSGDADLARMALLHDASEAYLGDIVRPLKDLDGFEVYRNAEAQTQRRILAHFGLTTISASLENRRVVDTVDNHILVHECRQLYAPAFHINQDVYGDPFSAGWNLKIGRWQPRGAELAFLAFFQEPSRIFS